MFRKLEVNSKRKITLQLHLQFNMSCIKENLLPVYTNIYIYIYTHLYTDIKNIYY